MKVLLVYTFGLVVLCVCSLYSIENDIKEIKKLLDKSKD
jgi:hypothetical protein